MKPHILVVYASTHGQTAKIAAHIAHRLEERYCTVVLANAADDAPAPGAFDGVVVGASLIARGHQPAVRKYVEAHVEKLNRVPTAFFSVSASAGSVHEDSRESARRIRDAFVASLGWKPVLTECIAGAVKFTRYNFLLRWYMKKASAMNGGATDTSRDHEYTDWHQVDGFADSVATAVRWHKERERPRPERASA